MILKCFKIHKVEKSHVDSEDLVQQGHLVWKSTDTSMRNAEFEAKV